MAGRHFFEEVTFMSRRAIRRTLAVACMLGLVAFSLLVYWNREPRVTEAQFRQAMQGTTLAQVEELFGGPGRPVVFQEDATHPGSLLVVLDCPGRRWMPSEEALDPASTWRVWRGYECLWVIQFKNEVLVQKFGAGDPGWVTYLRSHLGL
jgi:hypothetical protein